jgi:hypothetical protein
VAYLPLVVVTLVAEAVATAIRSEGVRSGLWRAAMTALVAVIVAAAAGTPRTSPARGLLRQPGDP